MKQDSFDEDDVRSQPSTLRFDHALQPGGDPPLRPKTPSFRSAVAQEVEPRTPYPAPPPMRLFNGAITEETSTSWNKKYWNSSRKKAGPNSHVAERDLTLLPPPSPMDPESSILVSKTPAGGRNMRSAQPLQEPKRVTITTKDTVGLIKTKPTDIPLEGLPKDDQGTTTAFNLDELMGKSRPDFHAIIGKMSNNSLVMLSSELADCLRKMGKHNSLRDKLLSKVL